MFLSQCAVVNPDMTPVGSANLNLIIFFKGNLVIGQILRLLNFRLNDAFTLVFLNDAEDDLDIS